MSVSLIAHGRRPQSRASCYVATARSTDKSGAARRNACLARRHSVTDRRIVKDDALAVSDAVRARLSGPARDHHDRRTGIAGRDMTLEAAFSFDKTLDGFGELFRR